jgi:hypothetical protein
MSSYIVLQTRAIGPCKEGNLPIMGCHVINPLQLTTYILRSKAINKPDDKLSFLSY